MDLMARRRLMMLTGVGPTPPQPSGGDLSDYVQDGLILHMDGKAGKTGSSSWSSVVGSVSFTNNGATFYDDYIYFDGTDDYLTNTSFSPTASGTGTIEVVIDNETFGSKLSLVFAGKTNGGLAFGQNTSKQILWSIGTSSRAKPVATLAKASFSICSPRKYQNGVAMTTNGSDYWGGRSSSTNYIGMRSTGGYFKGKIYSIRIYNRQLSSDEVLKNLAVDNIRFELGLTL